jgi:isopenicillin N synthase-like dioxygenase
LLLLQEDVGGLEVQDPLDENHYIEVTREQHGEMVINVSATFERWTNGAIKAAIHRVNITPKQAAIYRCRGTGKMVCSVFSESPSVG